LAFGFLWGLGGVTFAIGVDAVGIALGCAIIMGTITAVGAVTPVVRRWSTVVAARERRSFSASPFASLG
jgi:hypothetical protein